MALSFEESLKKAKEVAAKAQIEQTAAPVPMTLAAGIDDMMIPAYSPEEYDTANRYFMSLMLSGVSGFVVPACFLGIPYGWRFLTKLGILDIFMVLPIIGWIFCWTIKLVFSMLIGVVIVYKRIIVLIFTHIYNKYL